MSYWHVKPPVKPPVKPLPSPGYILYDPVNIESLQNRGKSIAKMDEDCILDHNIIEFNHNLINGCYPYETPAQQFVIDRCLDNHVVGLWEHGTKRAENPCCDFDLTKVNRKLLRYDKHKIKLDDLLKDQKISRAPPPLYSSGAGRKTKVKRRQKKPRKSKKKRSVTSNKI